MYVDGRWRKGAQWMLPVGSGAMDNNSPGDAAARIEQGLERSNRINKGLPLKGMPQDVAVHMRTHLCRVKCVRWSITLCH